MDKVTVRIASPVKIGEAVHMPGDEVDVDPETEAMLMAAGVLAGAGEAEPADRQAEPSAMEALAAERDAILARAEAAEARLAAFEADAREKAAATPTPAAPAKGTPKKGAAAAKG
jgi:hypothetical protein